jgi:hypothetical protein
MRLEPKKEAWLKFAHDFWDIDNGQSSLEIVEQMLTKHVEKARDTVYGYDGYLDETLGIAREAIKEADREYLVDTLHSLCDLGEGDAVARALKNVTLGAIQRNTGFRAVQPNGGAKITAGGSPSPVKFNGSIVKRGATKAFNKVVDAPTKAFNQVVCDSVNSRAKSILKEAAQRSAAAMTLKTHSIEKGKEMLSKQEYDSEETWTHYAKQEAGRMKSDTEAAKTVEPPALRYNDYNETRERLPPEFRNPKEIPNVVGMTLADLPKPPEIMGGKLPANTSMAEMTRKTHQNQQRPWDVSLNNPKRPKQGFDPVNGAV